MRIKVIIAKGIILILLLVISLPIVTLAKEDDNAIMNKENLAEFFDDIINEQMKSNSIAGVTLSVVKNDKILFNKAYGYLNSEKQQIYNEDTITKIGSITKVFVWQSILKLQEEGKIDINDPIDRYVDGLSYLNKYDTPIRIRHLMTHTAGFEDELTTLFRYNENPKQVLLDDYRRVIYRPGDIVAYSNYGAAIGGLIVENVSGMALNDYINKTIFKPLNMNRSTLNEPASDIYENVSYGHYLAKKGLQSIEDPFACYPAAGAMSTTAIDMAHYMIMQLNSGNYEGNQIISEQVIKMMHQPAFISHEGLPGITLGMMEWKRNNLDIIWHSGGNATFKSMLLLIPKEKVGFFISYNTAHSEESRNSIREAFLDRFYPFEIPEIEPLDNYQERVSKFEGYYKEARGSNHNSDKLIYLLSRSKKATANENGTLNFRDVNYIEIEPNIFRQVDGQGLLIFEMDDQGNPIRAYQDFEPHEAYISLCNFETPLFVFGSIITLLILNLTLLITGMIYKRKTNQYLYGSQTISKLINMSGLLIIVFPILAAGAMVMSIILNPEILLQANFPLGFNLSLLLPPIALLLLLIAVIRFVVSLKKGNMLFIQKIMTIIYIAVICGVEMWLIHFRLFGIYII